MRSDVQWGRVVVGGTQSQVPGAVTSEQTKKDCGHLAQFLQVLAPSLSAGLIIRLLGVALGPGEEGMTAQGLQVVGSHSCLWLLPV